MSCCGGGCCWRKKKPDPAPPPKHPPDPPPPIHPPDPPPPPTHPPDPPPPPTLSPDPPPPPIHPPDAPTPPIYPPDPSLPHPSMPSTHPPVEPSSSKKPFSPTLADVLKSFEDADIAKAADFIKAIRELLKGLTTQMNAQDTPTTSSNTDKLSMWGSFIQSGATFLKFANDHTRKIDTKGDFFQSQGVTKIVGDMLKQFGQVHWAVAGLSIVGYLILKRQEMSENQTGCLDLLKVMFDLASHITNLNFLTQGEEIKEKLENAFRYIVQGSISCASQLDSGKIFSFLKSSINSDTLNGIRSKIDLIYQDLQLATGIKTLEQQQEILALQQEMATKQQEIEALQQKMSTQQQEIVELQQEMSSQQQEIVALQQEMSTQQQEMATKQQEIEALQQKMSTQQQKMSTQQQEIVALQQEISTQQQEIVALQQEMSTQQQEILALQQEVSTKQQEIVVLQQEMSSKQKKILALQEETLALQPHPLSPSQPAYPNYAVGIEKQLEAVNTLLNMKKKEDCSSSAVVIWGFGGIGKTTLAEAVVSTVDRESYNYCRINLDEVSEKNNYMEKQQQILKIAFPNFEGGRKIELQDDADGRKKLTDALKSEKDKPVFLFIDNALHVEDLKKILPDDLGGLPQRSRILITTRILSITDMLQERGLQRKHHQVQTLSDDHAAEILCNDPAIRVSIKEDLKKMVELCSGIPLVLKIVGARLHKQKYNVDRCTQIVGALQSGGKIKENDLSNRLFHFVYEDLEEPTQEAFLDVCCFFDKGFPLPIVEYIVGAEAVTDLQEAALITTVMGKSRFFDREKYGFRGGNRFRLLSQIEELSIDNEGDKEEEDKREEVLLSVHDIIRSIGRSLSKTSGIMDLNSWREAEKDEGKLKGIKGVCLEENRDCLLEKRHLNSMGDTLRFLVWGGRISATATDAVRLPELRCMIIDGDVPWVNVEAHDKLIVLICNNLPAKLPESLRYIKVLEQPDEMPECVPKSNSSLQELDLFFRGRRGKNENAFNSFLDGLNKLKTLRVDNCASLSELPQQVCRLPQLSKLVFKRCFSLERLPQLFGLLESLTDLELSHCPKLKELPKSFKQLKTLRHLNLSGCTSLKELPESFGQLHTLEHLNLFHCEILEELPESIGQLKTLSYLNLSECARLKKLPESFGQLQTLRHLKMFYCTYLKKLPDSIGQLKTLRYLNMVQCKSLEELPESIGDLKTLRYLNLSSCEDLKELPSTFGKLEALRWLNLRYCTSLEKLPRGFEQLRSLQHLDLSWCDKLESDICLMDDNIKIVQKSEHFCSDCQKDKKLKIHRDT